MSTRSWMAFLAALFAVLGVTVTAPAQAPPTSIPRWTFESLRNDPDAVACLQTTCLDDSNPRRRTFIECQQDHQRRINATVQGRKDPALRGYTFSATAPSVEALFRQTCFRDRTPEAEALLVRNSAVIERADAVRSDLSAAMVQCHGAPTPLPPMPDLSVRAPTRENAEAQAHAVEGFLDALSRNIEAELGQSCAAATETRTASAETPMQVAAAVPKPQPSRKAARTVAVRSTDRVASCGLSHFDIRKKGADAVELYIRPGATVAELQRSCLAQDYETSDREIFDANEYRDTIPYCTQDGKLPRSASDFDPVRWKFQKDRTEVDVAFADACSGRFGIALQAKQVITLKAKGTTEQVSEKTDGDTAKMAAGPAAAASSEPAPTLPASSADPLANSELVAAPDASADTAHAQNSVPLDAPTATNDNTRIYVILVIAVVFLLLWRPWRRKGPKADPKAPRPPPASPKA